MTRPAWIVLLLALCTVPTCASLPQFPADGSYVAVRLPPFPESVPSTSGPVPVRLVKNLRCGTDRNPNLVWFGCYHYNPRRIEIEDTLALVMKWRTLSHEMVHLALHLDGVSLPDIEVENKIAEAIAKQQTHAMLMRWPR